MKTFRRFYMEEDKVMPTEVEELEPKEEIVDSPVEDNIIDEAEEVEEADEADDVADAV